MTERFGGVDKATARPDGLPLGRGTFGAVPGQGAQAEALLPANTPNKAPEAAERCAFLTAPNLRFTTGRDMILAITGRSLDG